MIYMIYILFIPLWPVDIMTIIGSGNGLLPIRGQAITRTKAGIVSWALSNKLQWNLNNFV